MSDSDANDRRLLDFLRQEGEGSIAQIVDLLGVTATAVRLRLSRLSEAGLIERKQDERKQDEGKPVGRGRPSYLYCLTPKGLHKTGTNFDDLAKVLWQEVRAIEDPEVRRGLLVRLAGKLAARYTVQLRGNDEAGLADRMRDLMRLMGERDVPINIDESGDLPVLNVLACPYPTLAEVDRTVCAMEKVMISEVLGRGVRLSECRLDGGSCCSFEPSVTPITEAPGS